jgi:hypothetical protein
MTMHALRRAAGLPGRLRRRATAALADYGRVPGLRTAKTTLAAVLAYVAAELLGTSGQPVLAALTALLVVQVTTYDTLAQGLQRIFSVLAGVLVALAVAAYAGLTWWSLGAVVAVSVVVGLVLRLGKQLMEVPISAMLVLAVGGAEDVAVGRVYETLVGAAVGVVVNMVIVPPLYLGPAGVAIGELAGRMAEFLRGLAAELRAGWSREAADRWLDGARALGAEVSRADQVLARAEQSARLNPRAGPVRQAQPRLRTALNGLEHLYVSLRGLCRTLLDRTYFMPADQQASAYDQRTRDALADVLDATAYAVLGVGPVASGTAGLEAARGEVETHVRELRRRRDRLRRLLLVDPHTDEGAWQQHGSLLAAVDRLRVEVESAVRPATGAWRPPLMSERQRQVVRRVRDAAVDLRPPAIPARTDRDRRRLRKATGRSDE